MIKINEVFEEYYSDMTEIEKKYFKTHGRYHNTDTVLAFSGFKEALRYKEVEVEKEAEVQRRKANNFRIQLCGIARNIMNQFPEEFGSGKET